MTYSEFISTLTTAFPTYPRRKIEEIADSFFAIIADSLKSGHRVELRGFGSFLIKKRSARLGSDPRTGDKISLPTRYTPAFRMSKSIVSTLIKEKK